MFRDTVVVIGKEVGEGGTKAFWIRERVEKAPVGLRLGCLGHILTPLSVSHVVSNMAQIRVAP